MKPEYKLDLDIAVCKVKENAIGGSYQPLNISQHNLRIGDRAVAIGYAEMKNIKLVRIMSRHWSFLSAR